MPTEYQQYLADRIVEDRILCCVCCLREQLMPNVCRECYMTYGIVTVQAYFHAWNFRRQERRLQRQNQQKAKR